MSGNSFYAIGKRDFGVIFINTVPLKVTFVSDENIQQYNTATGKDGYAELAGAAQSILTKIDKDLTSDIDPAYAEGVKELIRNGNSIHNVDFSFFAPTIDNTDIDFSRTSYNPLGHVTQNLFSETTGDPDALKDILAQLLTP